MVFQDPYNSLNPRFTIGDMPCRGAARAGQVPAAAIPARVAELLALVELDPALASRRPRELSGGQCQRAGIARALAVDPRLIVADECVAALDVTIQAQIIALFQRLVATMDLTLVFIAHDLANVRNLSARVVVMHHGRIVEEGPSDEVFARPREPTPPPSSPPFPTSTRTGRFWPRRRPCCSPDEFAPDAFRLAVLTNKASEEER